MSKTFVIYAVGKLLEVLAMAMIIPAAIVFYELPLKNLSTILNDPAMLGFLIAIPLSFMFGAILKVVGNSELSGNGIKEGFAIVTFGWMILTLFGAVPLMVYFASLETGHMTLEIGSRIFTDSYFEIMSGFTTTGATILTNIEAVPRGILFWRSLTHWLGGMGIVTLALAVLPVFGVASYQMFRGEVPGPTAERLKPRLAETAKILWGAYILLTLAETVLLMFGGMTLFDALCHSFGTMATGGFSTKNGSIAAYNSAYIDWVVIAFMFFAGMNFVIHYQILFARKFQLIKKNAEFHFYAVVLLLAVVLSVGVLKVQGVGSVDDVSGSFRNNPLSTVEVDKKIITEEKRLETTQDIVRHAAFQVVSITTTTGYCTADFDVWPNFIRFMLVVLMFFGGCAGSTGGGIKMVRVMVSIKTAMREIRTLIQPRIILPIKIEGEAVEEKMVANILGFVILFLGCFVVFSGIMSFIVKDFTTAVTAVVATICNIGPGLSGVGAFENYAWIPLPGKWVLTICMLLGRLEIYTVFIAFSPIAWKK